MYSVKFNKAELLCKDWYEMKKYLETLQPEIYHKQIIFNKDNLVEVINLLKKYGGLPYSFYTFKNNDLWWLGNNASGELELIRVDAKLTNPARLEIYPEKEPVIVEKPMETAVVGEAVEATGTFATTEDKNDTKNKRKTRNKTKRSI